MDAAAEKRIWKNEAEWTRKLETRKREMSYMAKAYGYILLHALKG